VGRPRSRSAKHARRWPVTKARVGPAMAHGVREVPPMDSRPCVSGLFSPPSRRQASTETLASRAAGCASAWPPSPPAFGPAVRPNTAKPFSMRYEVLASVPTRAFRSSPTLAPLTAPARGGLGEAHGAAGAQVRPSATSCSSSRHGSGRSDEPGAAGHQPFGTMRPSRQGSAEKKGSRGAGR
jgi:hypothetical protein